MNPLNWPRVLRVVAYIVVLSLMLVLMIMGYYVGPAVKPPF